MIWWVACAQRGLDINSCRLGKFGWHAQQAVNAGPASKAGWTRRHRHLPSPSL